MDIANGIFFENEIWNIRTLAILAIGDRVEWCGWKVVVTIDLAHGRN